MPDYKIYVEKETYKNEVWYIAYCKELGRGSCYGLGDTPEEARENFLKDKDKFLELLKENNILIPEPEETL